jgi:DNA-binding MarR family transcriptional regulator
VPEQVSLNQQFKECLDTWGISLPEEWDLLVFLHRHRKSLLTVGQISSFLGYGEPAVSHALKKLETAGLVRHSHSSQEIRFRHLAASVSVARQDSFELLLKLFDHPPARHFVVAELARAPAFAPGPPLLHPLQRAEISGVKVCI